ncbi:transglutaminase-like putative cysteine protease [Oxalobacteraceae bacterium GrIS 2.11]
MNKIARALPFKIQLPVLTRDKADTLLLLVTSCFVLFPFAQHSPIWLNAIALILISWRAWITLQGQALPKKWLLTVICAALSVGIYVHFHTWLGKEAGIAFLIILVCLKMLELHARRDALTVIFVCYFLLVAQLIYSQSLLSGLYLLFCTGLIISTQFTFQYHRLIPPLSTRLLNGYKIVAIALPLALILFLFFPRIQGPLWGKQQGNVGGITGLSDSMEPGNVAELALSDQIAFRVKFDGRIPAASQLYWRGIVLDTFSGSRWTVSESSGNRSNPSAITNGVPISQEIILEPHNQHWLFGLDRPGNLTSYNGNTIDGGNNQYGHLTRYGEMRSQSFIQDRVRYTITSYLNGSAGANPGSTFFSSEPIDVQNSALQLPEGFNPLTIRWAQQLRQNDSDPLQLANQVLRFFHEQPFKYTLAPAPLGTNQIDDFMFGTQAGFCEHYASAFVVIMRAMNIPSRVVTGYQGGEINAVDGFMTVRQSDAHAWAEIWLDQRGWVRFDPTAAVSPERVERGFNGSFPNRNRSGLMSFAQQTWVASLAKQFQLRWDATNSSWNLWILNYNLDKQKRLLSNLSGIEHPQAAQLGVAMMIAASLVVSILSLLLFGKKNTVIPIDKYYFGFCQYMGRQGFARLPHEGSIAYSQRLQYIFKNNADIAEFLTLYTLCKYGRGYNSDQLNRLKELLNLCLQLKPPHANSSQN